MNRPQTPPAPNRPPRAGVLPWRGVAAGALAAALAGCAAVQGGSAPNPGAPPTSDQALTERVGALETQVRQLQQSLQQTQQELDQQAEDARPYTDDPMNLIQRWINEIVHSGGWSGGHPSQWLALNQVARRLATQLEAERDNFNDWNLLAFAAFANADNEEAAQDWQRASASAGGGTVDSVQALYNRAVALDGLPAQTEQARAAYRQLIDAYAGSDDIVIEGREIFARALFKLGLSLEKEQPNEAIATYQKLIDAYAPFQSKSAVLRDLVAVARYNIGQVIDIRAEPAREIALYQKFIATYAPGDTPLIREVAAQGMFSLGLAFYLTRQPAQAVTIYTRIIDTYAADAAPGVRDAVNRSLNNRAMARLQMARKAWPGDRARAAALLRAALSDLRAYQRRGAGDDGIVLASLAYVQWLRGDRQAAEANLRAAFADPDTGGETLYRSVLDDLTMYPIAPNHALRRMIDRVWNDSHE